jgi:hypothetical protein
LSVASCQLSVGLQAKPSCEVFEFNQRSLW